MDLCTTCHDVYGHETWLAHFHIPSASFVQTINYKCNPVLLRTAMTRIQMYDYDDIIHILYV